MAGDRCHPVPLPGLDRRCHSPDLRAAPEGLPGPLDLDSPLGFSLLQPRWKCGGKQDKGRWWVWATMTELNVPPGCVKWGSWGCHLGTEGAGAWAAVLGELGIPDVPKEGRVAQQGWASTHSILIPLSQCQPQSISVLVFFLILNSIPPNPNSHPHPILILIFLPIPPSPRHRREGTLGIEAATPNTTLSDLIPSHSQQPPCPFPVPGRPQLILVPPTWGPPECAGGGWGQWVPSVPVAQPVPAQGVGLALQTTRCHKATHSHGTMAGPEGTNGTKP